MVRCRGRTTLTFSTDNSTPVALFNRTGDSTAGDDFTKVLVSDEYAGLNEHTNPFTPATVRTVDTSTNYSGLASDVTAQITVIRQSGKVYFNVQKDADIMGHSLATQADYIKTDDG